MIVDGFPFCIQLAISADAGNASLNDLFSGLVGAVLGGLIGIVSSYFAVKWQYSVTRKIDNERLDNEVEGVIQSIYEEIETIYRGYVSSIGKHVEKLGHGKAFSYNYRVSEDYFTIYNSNAALIGKITDRQLRSLMVNTYTKGKMLLDSFRYNNEILSRHEHNYDLFFKEKDHYYRLLANHEHEKLVLVASEIRERHIDATESANKLLRYIEQRKPKAA